MNCLHIQENDTSVLVRYKKKNCKQTCRVPDFDGTWTLPAIDGA